MTEPAPTSGPSNGGNDSTPHGDGLLDELRAGWRPLPFRAVLSLVLAGLKVRLSRSVVTMVTVVLAITFLTYTGLSGKVNRTLATLSVELSETPAVPPAEAAAAAKALPAAVLAAELQPPVRDWLALWIPEPADEIAADLEELRALPVADEAREAHLVRKLELKRRLEGRSSDLTEERAFDDGRAVFETEAGRLLVGFRNPSVWNDVQMEQAEMLTVLAAQADHPSAQTLARSLEAETLQRQGAELASLLRRAGINIEAVLGDNFMDTWIIFMALLLCAVGIANAMLMSVTERFREIGTMKCLGAQDGLVVQLFLLESAFLGVAGALLGLIVGLIVALLGAVLQFGGFGLAGFPLLGSLEVMGYALLAGVLLALAGTLYPALLAARMKPVDALRIDE